MGWHLGTVFGLHHIFIVIIAYHLLAQGGTKKYKFVTHSMLFGLVSYLEIKATQTEDRL